MNTCKLTIDHHPDTDQCGEDMIHYAVHLEPVNIDLPRWITNAATSHMCADKAKEHGHHMNMPYVDPVIKAMADKGLDTVVVLAPDYWDIEEASWANAHSRIANRLNQLPTLWGRPAVVVDLGEGTITAVTREQAWDAR